MMLVNFDIIVKGDTTNLWIKVFYFYVLNFRSFLNNLNLKLKIDVYFKIQIFIIVNIK